VTLVFCYPPHAPPVLSPPPLHDALPIFQCYTIPELNAGFDGYPVPDTHTVLYKDVSANIAVAANLGSRQHNAKLPDFRSRPDRSRLNIGRGMDLHIGYCCRLVGHNYLSSNWRCVLYVTVIQADAAPTRQLPQSF